MRITLGSKSRFEPGSVMESVVDYATGTCTGTVRATQIMFNWVYVNTVRPFANHILGYQLSSGTRPKINDGTIKVAAVGFGRTGTYSVTLALEELGYPTLHTIHMYAYENEEILHMLDETILSPAIEKENLALGKMDFGLIANSGYQAVADLPFVFFYEQILADYPDCKFILTTRATSEIWYKSWESMTTSVSNGIHIAAILLPTMRFYSKYLRWMYAMVNNDTTYLTSTIPNDQNIQVNAIATYEEHNRRIRELIPTNQLLEYDVRGGWGPLCTFLDITSDQCPTTPFPKTNSAKQMQAQSFAAFCVGCIIFFVMIQTIRRMMAKRQHTKEKNA